MSYSRAVKVMEYCSELIHRLKLLSNAALIISDLSFQNADKIFTKMYEKLVTDIYELVPKRIDEISYGRIYNLICLHKKKE